MTSACVRNMTIGQNIHTMPQNCVLISSQNSSCVPVNQLSNKIPISTASTLNTSSMKNQIMNTTTTSVLGMNGINVQVTDGHRYKKKYSYANLPYGEQPPSVARRNARERNRVKQVNNGFANLRQHIPQTIITALTNGGRGASKKLSKVDTLRLAVEYIRRLQDLLGENHALVKNNSGLMKNHHNSITSTSSLSQQSFYPSSSPEHNNFTTQNQCSENSPSPTPSYNSDISIGGNNYIQSPEQFKFESYENFNSMRTEDEELLDYISSWQDQ